eukprot:15458616-Alexandrium_andersonii.AAC.1
MMSVWHYTLVVTAERPLAGWSACAPLDVHWHQTFCNAPQACTTKSFCATSVNTDTTPPYSFETTT